MSQIGQRRKNNADLKIPKFFENVENFKKLNYSGFQKQESFKRAEQAFAPGHLITPKPQTRYILKKNPSRKPYEISKHSGTNESEERSQRASVWYWRPDGKSYSDKTRPHASSQLRVVSVVEQPYNPLILPSERAMVGRHLALELPVECPSYDSEARGEN